MFKNNQKGFTLIELLVVIAIIAILASILFVAIDPAGQSNKAKITQAKAELKQIAEAVYTAKSTEGKSAVTITGSGCSACSCRNGDETSTNCSNKWKNVREKISAIDFYPQTNIMAFKTDPWGIPYLLDENEGEGGHCNKDSLFSAGPNKINNNRGGDDIVFWIPHVTSLCN